MKAFRFRLDQALRWRATQVDIEKGHVSQAAARLANIRASIESLRNELTVGSRQLSGGSTGSALENWGTFTESARRRISEFEKQAKDAEQALAKQMSLLVEANRKQQLLENLKQTAHGRWQAEFGKELEAFAGEAFLGRLQSKGGRARSSGG